MIPDLPGKEHLISSNECFELEQLPGSIVIIGAGYIGMEFASIFAGLGVAVTVLYRGDQILRDFDMDLRDGLAEAMRNRGVDLRMDTDVASVEKEGRGYRVHLKRGDSVAADLVMAATGRVPNTIGLGLARRSASSSAGTGAWWSTNSRRASVDNIYAVGDVTHRVNLTPVAIHEATAFAETLFNDKPTPVDHTLHPDGGVLAARDRHGRAHRGEGARDVSQRRYLQGAASGRCSATVSGRDEKMLMKLVVDMESDKVLGCHILGRRRGRDRADGGDRAQARRDQGAVRRHHGAASERGRGTRDDAPQMGGAGAGGGVRCGGLRTRSRW